MTQTTPTHPLSIASVSKAFGHHKVLKNISLDMEEGEMFGLIGLNGAGKTTLIKIILDMVSRDQGEVHCFGRPVLNASARQNLAYLPEKFHPPRALKGMDYVTLALSYYGRSCRLDQAQAKLASLDLNPQVLTERISSYSKGMGQKLGLASTFLIDAPLLILDEPMSGLDPRARIFLKDELLAQKQAGKSIFFSSHILSDIDEICDRIGIIHDGKLLYVGTPAAFKEQHGHDHLERAFLTAIGTEKQAA